MSELRATLVPPLPERVAVGRGTALFCEGTCSADAGRIRRLRLVVDGADHPVIAHGLPVPGSGDRSGGFWWAILPLPGLEADRVSTIGLAAELDGGGEARAELGDLELIAGPGIPATGIADGNGKAIAHGSNGHRSWSPRGGPLIAIAMTTCDPPPELFERQIASIRGQTHENWICVVGDDASKPDRLAAIREALGDDPRFRLVTSEGRRGVYRNFERVLGLVPPEAEYVALCDQDDRWHPDKLEVLLAEIGPEGKLAYSDMRIVTPEGTVVSDTYWTRRRNNHTNFASLLIANTVTGAATLVRRGVLDYALPFPQQYGEQHHDHWLAIVAMALGKIEYVARPLYDYVQHDAAALGHGAANRGRSSGLGERWETIRSRRLLLAWRELYFHHYCRLLLCATVLRLRCSNQLTDEKARVLTRVLSSDSPKGIGWLWLRSVRARLGASETMSRDRALVRALVWKRLARRSDDGVGKPGAARDAGYPRPEGPARAPEGRSLAIQALGVSKSFRIPLQANSTLARRIMHPHDRHGYRRLSVLEDISFEVAQGEFFGIIGRNGSGKSTLLKLLASIYGTDTGMIRVAGQVAPILELGVGFHPELAARDNAIVNGVMMGLSQRQAADRFEQVIEFAELEGFETMKLRNYSSGMKIRLAFAIMVEADGDVMMIDEVLAVGDTGFQRKCSEVFRRYKEQGKTVILVSHQMTSIKELCDRVMLLEGGHIERIGDPDEATLRYSELAVAGTPARPLRTGGAPLKTPDDAMIADVWIGAANGERTPVVPASEPIRIHAVIEAEEAIEDPCFRFEIRNENRARIFSPPSSPLNGDRLDAGQRVQVEATIENKLTPGTYILSCALNRRSKGKEIGASAVRSVEFAVPGARPRGQGLLSLEHEVTLEPLGEAEASNGRGAGA